MTGAISCFIAYLVVSLYTVDPYILTYEEMVCALCSHSVGRSENEKKIFFAL